MANASVPVTPTRSHGPRFMRIFAQRKRGQEEVGKDVLSALSLLQQQAGPRPLSLFLIHSFVDHIEPLAKVLDFAEQPIPYSARLSHILDDLVRRDYLDQFVIFDDHLFPQTVYRLALRGRVEANEHLLDLPPGTADLARKMLDEVTSYRESTPQARAIQSFAP